MLISSFIVICWYLYSVCLVSRVLKNIYFKDTFQWLLPNIAYSIWKIENNAQKFELCLMFKYSANSKGVVLAPNGIYLHGLVLFYKFDANVLILSFQVILLSLIKLYSPVPNNRGGGRGGVLIERGSGCITASGNILASGNIS